nr:MAG TPA: hypothetical protein [Caudoviricetes sp.]
MISFNSIFEFFYANLSFIYYIAKDGSEGLASYFRAFERLHLNIQNQRCVLINAVCLFSFLIFRTQTVDFQQSNFLTYVNTPRYCLFLPTFYAVFATLLGLKWLCFRANHRDNCLILS